MEVMKMNNVISNEKKVVSKGTNLNDKDYLNNLLCSLKDLCKNYCTVLTEVSNESLYSKVWSRRCIPFSERNYSK